MYKSQAFILVVLVVLIGCSDPLFEALGNLATMDGPPEVTVMRGGAEEMVALEVETLDKHKLTDVSYSDPAHSTNPDNAVAATEANRDSTNSLHTTNFKIQSEPEALLQTYEITFTAKVTVCTRPTNGVCSGSAMGGTDPELNETETHTLKVNVIPALNIDITAPANDTTTARSVVTVEANVADQLDGVVSVKFVLNGDTVATVFDDDANPRPNLSVSQDVTLSNVGANTVTIVARNKTGSTLTESIQFDYQPVAAGVVRWDGGGGDNLWTTATNWDTDALPGAGDSVIIEDAAITVIHELTTDMDITEVRSLSSKANIEHRTPGTLRFNEASEIEGKLTMLSAGGAGFQNLEVGATLTLSGGLRWESGNIIGGTVRITSGARVDYLDASLDNVTFDVEGIAVMPDNAAALLTNQARIRIAAGGQLSMASTTGGIYCGDNPCTGVLENRGDISIHAPGIYAPSIQVFTENYGSIVASALTNVVFVGGVNRSGGSIDVTGGSGQLLLQDWTLENGSFLNATSLVVNQGSLAVQGALDVDRFSAEANTSVMFGIVADIDISQELTVDGADLEIRTGDDLFVQMVGLVSGRLYVGTGSRLLPTVGFTWAGGTLTGPGRTTVDGIPTVGGVDAVLYITAGAAPLRLDDGHHLGSADLTFWSGGDIEAGNGAVFVNGYDGDGAIFEISSDNSFLGDFLGGIATFENGSLIRKIGGLGTTTLRVCYDSGGSESIEEQQGTVSIVTLAGCP